MSKVDKAVNALTKVYGAFHELSFDAATRGILPKANSGGHHHPNGHSHYLWTDAFGVMNMISLWKTTHDDRFLTSAKRLVYSVHDTLGYTRDGQYRLPRATDDNPVGGGLRIGKVDEAGPDGDGQYHHYLTLWMFALNRLSKASEDMAFNDLGISLARAIHPHFLVDRGSGGRPRMVWKISMDMTRPLVSSQGNLDAITGYVVYRLLQVTSGTPNCLASEIADYKQIMDSHGPPRVSSDTLDLGMGLWIAQWDAGIHGWADTLVQECNKSLSESHPTQHLSRVIDCNLHKTAHVLNQQRYTYASLKHRLAFREFGALLGIECSDQDKYLESRVDPITDMWENWLRENGATIGGRVVERDLEPITEVMYVAVLLPHGERKGHWDL